MSKSTPSFSVRVPIALPRNKQAKTEQYIDRMLGIAGLLILIYGIATIILLNFPDINFQPTDGLWLALPYLSFVFGLGLLFIRTIWRRREHGQLVLREHSISIQLRGRPRFSHKLRELHRLRFEIEPPESSLSTNRSSPMTALMPMRGGMQQVHRASNNQLFYNTLGQEQPGADQSVDFILRSPREFKRLRYLLKLWREHGYRFEIEKDD